MTGRANVGTLTDVGPVRPELQPVNGYLTVVQIAARIDRSSSAIARWIQDGELDSFTYGRTKLVTEESLAKFIRMHNRFAYKRNKPPKKTGKRQVAKNPFGLGVVKMNEAKLCETCGHVSFPDCKCSCDVLE